jgi:hypothetical protein
LRLTSNDLAELIVAILLGGSVLLAVLTAALRLGVRPLLADWAKLRVQLDTTALERRMVEMEEEIRQLKVGSSLQLPADPLRSPGRPRT